MADSFQHEIPKARINITLNVETAGASNKKELPLKLLVLSDYSNGQTTGPVGERERINVNKNNFNQIMQNLGLKMSYTVPNRIKNDGADIKVNLGINHIKDFYPEQVARTVPELNNLLAMRNLLKDLKASIIDNKNFRRELESIAKEKQTLDALSNELKTLAPLQEKTETETVSTEEEQ